MSGTNFSTTTKNDGKVVWQCEISTRVLPIETQYKYSAMKKLFDTEKGYKHINNYILQIMYQRRLVVCHHPFRDLKEMLN